MFYQYRNNTLSNYQTFRLSQQIGTKKFFLFQKYANFTNIVTILYLKSSQIVQFANAETLNPFLVYPILLTP